jgi:DHA1 family bicyclomycin/chloramphenicol resistance-like MFS transporter
MDSINREERMLAARNERPAVSLQIPFVEFVGLTAALMALTALSIDIMLPALPQIGSALGVTSENDRQLIIIL